MSKVYALLARLDSRLLAALMALVVCLLAFQGWILLLKGPQAVYQKQLAMHEALAASLTVVPDQQRELKRLAAQVREVSARVAGLAPAPEAQLASVVMAELDRSAHTHGVTLAGIRPGPRREVLSFEEASFEVSAQGDYLRLCAWLMDFERTLGRSATVTEFSMRAANEGREVALAMKVALYRPLRHAGVAG